MSLAQLNVLVVDDDPQILRLLEKVLRPHCASVLLTTRPFEALRICEAQPVDLMITDLVMPEMDGNRLAERVIKLRPEIRVLLISGNHREPTATRHPNVRYLRKPFFPSWLIDNLRDLLPDL